MFLLKSHQMLSEFLVLPLVWNPPQGQPGLHSEGETSLDLVFPKQNQPNNNKLAGIPTIRNSQPYWDLYLNANVLSFKSKTNQLLQCPHTHIAMGRGNQEGLETIQREECMGQRLDNKAFLMKQKRPRRGLLNTQSVHSLDGLLHVSQTWVACRTDDVTGQQSLSF